MERYVCIHGHFYQPPRENPWLEAIELQDSAYPYHDWNERITAECYAANGVSRILDGEGFIERIVNNYAKISFNFGPTLLAWMEGNAPETYQAILAADRESQEIFHGHGSALAQAYSHMILPLANRRDKQTQILWGTRDFEYRFKRKPEGMWLPETAVDLETLEILAEQGIRFTILSPHQARRVRPLGGRAWRDVSGGRIDPSMAYRLRFRSRRHIDLFFYDGPIAQAVAFEGLLTGGEHLAGRLLGAFSDARTWPQLVHIATDGETYGHHHRHGDMALAYAIHHIESNNLARITNPGEYLEKHPPTHEVEIFENSSWSCAHGVERWRSNCGCNSGAHPGWSQEWRGRLREALDWLRDALVPSYEAIGLEFFNNPWAARNNYIDVILDRSPENVDGFFQRSSKRQLSEEEKVRALKLMELQRHAMLMYTSCGWFFDDLSGIESVQVIQYASRALQLSEELFGGGLESGFLKLLEHANSNLPEHRNGRLIYDKFVKPARVDLQKAGGHYAVSSLFEEYGERARIYCYTVDREDHRLLTAGKVRVALGRAKITSGVTHESDLLTFGVVHLGDHNVMGGIRRCRGEQAYGTLVQEVSDVFATGDIAEVIRVVERNFGSGAYSLKLLFRDPQRRILGTILESTLEDAEALYRRFYQDHAPLMRFVTELGLPVPRRLTIAAEFILNADLQRALASPELDRERIHSLLEEARLAGVALDSPRLEFALRRNIEQMADQLREQPEDVSRLEVLETAMGLADTLPFELNLWKPQNVYHDLLQSVYPMFRAQLPGGNDAVRNWVAHFTSLGGKLRVRIPPGHDEKSG